MALALHPLIQTLIPSLVPSVLIVAIVAALTYLAVQRRPPPNFPKGPANLPFVGAYLAWLLTDYHFPHLTVEKWAKKYSSGFVGFFVGAFKCVVVTGNAAVRKALETTDFDGRVDAYAARIRAMGQPLGVIFVDGPFWKEQRRFSLRHMRDFGHGRRFPEWEMNLEQDMTDLIATMRNGPTKYGKSYIREDKHVLMPDLFYTTTLMGIMRILGVRQFDDEDHDKLHKVGRSTVYLQQNFFPLGGALSIFPWVRYFAPKLSGYHGIMQSNEVLMDYCKEVVQEFQKHHEDGNKDTFFDTYIEEMKERNDKSSGFFDDQLLVLVADYIFPAISTLSVTLSNLLRFLVYYPSVQRKVQEEIDAVVGRSRLPNLNDRQNLPYTEATLRECMRRETLVPLGVPHRVITDHALENDDKILPQDTMLVTSLYGANMDTSTWQDPENFRPERFIGEDGKLVRKDLSVPFGLGKRVCAGETYARNLLFVAYSALVQNFHFDHSMNCADVIGLTENRGGMVNMPRKEFWLRYSSRD